MIIKLKFSFSQKCLLRRKINLLMILCHLLHVYIRIAPSYGQRHWREDNHLLNFPWPRNRSNGIPKIHRVLPNLSSGNPKLEKNNKTTNIWMNMIISTWYKEIEYLIWESMHEIQCIFFQITYKEKKQQRKNK